MNSTPTLLSASAALHDPAASVLPHHSGRLLATLLLAAAVAALALATDRLMSTWADDHVFKTWLALWAVVFAGSLLFAGTARRMGQRLMAGLDAWARQRAQARAEARTKVLLREIEALLPAEVAASAAETPTVATPDATPFAHVVRDSLRGRQFDLYYV